MPAGQRLKSVGCKSDVPVKKGGAVGFKFGVPSVDGEAVGSKFGAPTGESTGKLGGVVAGEGRETSLGI
jgi:hypothetical protein